MVHGILGVEVVGGLCIAGIFFAEMLVFALLVRGNGKYNSIRHQSASDIFVNDSGRFRSKTDFHCYVVQLII